MEMLLRGAGVVGVGFLCLHQKPREERYKTYWHQLEHTHSKIFGGYGGFGVSGVPVMRGNDTYYLRGYACAECGHISSVDKILNEKSDLDDVILNRIPADLWMTDKEWCEVSNLKKID